MKTMHPAKEDTFPEGKLSPKASSSATASLLENFAFDLNSQSASSPNALNERNLMSTPGVDGEKVLQ